MTSDAPQRLGDYEILKVLGAGGMGRVYQVRNVITDRVEAMKVLLPEIGGQEEVAARFLREIKVLAALNHPHIARLHTALTIDNQLVMIMEFVEGQPISACLAGGPIPVPDALTYIDQILDALSYAHQQHVIHRDIKPANMMLTPDGTVKLMDFGIARAENEPTMLTAPGSTLGSMNYMSPEQVKGERTDERSDLYSLGISLYEMVTGERPFHGDSSFSLMAAHINQAPTPPVELQPEMPVGLNQIILTSIAKSPADRFQSADAFRNAVQAVLRDLQESKTLLQGSQDATAAGSRTPLPHVRTGPITRPKTQTPVPAAPAYAAPTKPAAAYAPTKGAAAFAPTIVRPTAASAAAPAPAVMLAPPPPAPEPARPASHRGLLISLGAVVVLVVLVAAGIYIPRGKKASAADEGSRPDMVKQQPENTKPPEVIPPPEKSAKKELKRRTGDRLSAEDAQAAAEAAAAAKAKAAERDQVEHEIDQLTSRAASANSSVENVQRQQNAMGVGLRGDVAQHLAGMKVNLAKAQDAIARGDVERAKRYASLADADIEALEKFLGR